MPKRRQNDDSVRRNGGFLSVRRMSVLKWDIIMLLAVVIMVVVMVEGGMHVW
jgi:hypothetical protein